MPTTPPARSPSDEAFLADYDPSPFPRPSVAVDAVVLTLGSGGIELLAWRRTAPPFADVLALPGGFVRIDEPLEGALARVLAQKAGIVGGTAEQLHTFGDPGRDPRLRVISVAWLVLLPAKRVPTERFTRVPVGPEGAAVPLAFDHAAILAVALQRLRRDVDRLGFALLPPRFTLRQLQDVHEAALGVALNKDSFRRRLLATGRLVPTGERQAGVEHRPAELYTLLPGG